MAITVYADVPAFIAVLPVTAWGAKTASDVQAALADFSAEMDDYFRGVFPLPFASVGPSVSKRCAYGARYNFLGGRGFSPEGDADKDIVRAYEKVMEWLVGVQRRTIFPDVKIDPTAAEPPKVADQNYAQPVVLSSSVVDSNGRRAPTRCW